jgi:DNA relaxase NicK
LDWLTACGPAELLEQVKAWAIGRFGSEFSDQGGFKFYGRSMRWAGGPIILTDHLSADSICVEIQGGSLVSMEADERVEIVRELLELGLHFTRLDVAVDHMGNFHGFIQRVRESAEAGELCGARCWAPIKEFSGRDRLVSEGVTFGKRGSDGSGRFVCLYDKGLESGTLSAGCWVRWETRFAADLAHDVAVRLARADSWVHVAASVAFGAVDFRVVNGRHKVAERCRVAWWADHTAMVEMVRVKAAAAVPTLEGFKRWMRTSVAPRVLRLAADTGQRVSEVWREMIVGAEPSRLLSLVDVEYAKVRGCWNPREVLSVA